MSKLTTQVRTIYAVLGYVRSGGKTLMLYRNKKHQDIHEGKWNGLGGKIEAGETPEEAIKREIFEESGLQATELDFKGMITFPYFVEGENWVVYLFNVGAFTGEVKAICDEGDLHWIANEKLSDLNLWEGDKLFFTWMDGNRFFSAKMKYVAGKLAEHDVAFYGAG